MYGFNISGVENTNIYIYVSFVTTNTLRVQSFETTIFKTINSQITLKKDDIGRNDLKNILSRRSSVYRY